MKAIKGHLVDFEYLKEWLNYEDHIWYGGAMSLIEQHTKAIPSKEEYDRICKELSGEVIVWHEN